MQPCLGESGIIPKTIRFKKETASMKGVLPSERIRQEWNQLLCPGTSGEENLLAALVRTGARYMLQMAIEQEVTEFLEQGHYQRGDRNREGYRNSYEPKKVLTGQGPP